MARRLTRAAHAIGDRSITDIDNLCHNIYRWERERVVPGERYKLYYCHAFGISPSEYGINKIKTEGSVGDLAMTALALLAAELCLRRNFNGQTLIIWRDQDSGGRGNAKVAVDGLRGTDLSQVRHLRLVRIIPTL